MRIAETKQQLLDVLAKSRAKLETTIAKIPPDKMSQPGVNGDWAAKDVLAHLSAWEHYQIGWTEAALRGEKPEVPAPGLTFSAADLDRINRAIFEAHCHETADDVLREFRATHEQFIRQIESIPEADLTRPGFASFTGPKRALVAWYVGYALHDGWANRLLYDKLVRKPRKPKA